MVPFGPTRDNPVENVEHSQNRMCVDVTFLLRDKTARRIPSPMLAKRSKPLLCRKKSPPCRSVQLSFAFDMTRRVALLFSRMPKQFNTWVPFFCGIQRVAGSRPRVECFLQKRVLSSMSTLHHVTLCKKMGNFDLPSKCLLHQRFPIRKTHHDDVTQLHVERLSEDGNGF